MDTRACNQRSCRISVEDDDSARHGAPRKLNTVWAELGGPFTEAAQVEGAQCHAVARWCGVCV